VFPRFLAKRFSTADSQIEKLHRCADHAAADEVNAAYLAAVRSRLGSISSKLVGACDSADKVGGNRETSLSASIGRRRGDNTYCHSMRSHLLAPPFQYPHGSTLAVVGARGRGLSRNAIQQVFWYDWS
jgi:hypothetical protein